MALAEAPRREQDATAGARTVCLLQGPSSYFFDLLGDALISEGASAFRVCFCAGDRLFWRRKPHVWFRGGLSAWPAALRALIEERGVTDLVMLGDSRARHRAALAVAKAAGVLGHVVEHGYFRPDWLTHEIGGMGPRSSVRREFREGRLPEAAPGSPPDAARIYRSSFAAYAAMDVAYNLSNVFTRPVLAPRYEGHSTVWPLVEYAGWLRKLAVAPARARRAKAALARAAESERPMFLWALQLEADYQIRRDGVGAPQRALIAPILTSFAAHAPTDALLLVKAHPLDNLWTPWARDLRRAAARNGIEDRVWFLDGGDLDGIIERVEGVVCVNSTVGLRAIGFGKPTLPLGDALYGEPGLAHLGGMQGLDAFWRDPQPPEPHAVGRFLQALMARTQFRGAFDGEGAEPGAETLARRMLAKRP